MRFGGIRLVEQTEQKFRRFECVFQKRKKTSDCNSRALLLIEALSKNPAFCFLSLRYCADFRRSRRVGIFERELLRTCFRKLGICR